MSFDCLAIGNAIVDVIAQAEEDFLLEQDVPKGAMRLIDEQSAEKLYKAMGPATILSGGSAANTIVGAAMLGAKTAFIGKVRNDALGASFTHDIRASHVMFTTPPAEEGPATARSFILVTPDGERTMNTYLGACLNLTPADIDEEAVRASKITYLEGYLWDPPQAKEAFRKAIRITKDNNNRVALTLSDPFCVDRWRAEFLDLIDQGAIDILFANIHELKSLFQTADETAAIEALKQKTCLAAVTRSSEGAIVLENGISQSVAAFPVEALVDTTGAGDLFAAGFLAGLAFGSPSETCARLGALAASHIIQHLGARPQKDLKALAQENGLL